MDTTITIPNQTIIGPRRTFVPQICFVCGCYDFTTIDLKTDFPSWIYNVCSDASCKQHAKACLLQSIYSDEIVFQERNTSIECKVKRTSGEIETGWTVYGILLERHGNHKVIVMKDMMQKILQIDVVCSLNSDIWTSLQNYIQNVQNELAMQLQILE